MTTQKYTKSYFISVTALLVIILSASLFGREPFDKPAIKNLVNGIKSENEGLKRSSIYFAGKYEYPETVNALTTQLKQEKNPGTRLLIANALFRIGDAEAMNSVLELSKSDTNPKVRRIAGALYEAFVVANSSNSEYKLVKKYSYDDN